MILTAIGKENDENCIQIRSNEIYDWNKAGSIVLPKLINYEKNKGILQDMVYTRYLDFAVVFYIPLDMRNRYNCNMSVNRTIMSRWQVNEQELYQKAIENGRLLVPAQLQYLDDVILQMLEERECDMLHFDDMVNYIGMNAGKRLLVLSNKKNIFGAVTMLYTGVLHKIAEGMQSSFLVLPSGIHELILVKTDGLYEKEIRGYAEIVREINSNKELVSDEEFLSDNVYFYDRDEGKLIIT